MILFDFDGVLINSVDEVVVTSYNVASGELQTSLDSLSPAFVELFRKNRFHLQAAGDFGLFAKFCIENQHLASSPALSKEEFNRAIVPDQLSSTERAELFFAKRSCFIDANLESWLQLHRTFEPLCGEIRELRDLLLVILTNKNRAAVMQIAQAFDLPIHEENVYSADGGATKITNLRQIRERFGEQEYHFIDDSVKNLIEIKGKTTERECPQLLLASWGYNGPDDAELANGNGIPLVTQQSFHPHIAGVALEKLIHTIGISFLSLRSGIRKFCHPGVHICLLSMI